MTALEKALWESTRTTNGGTPIVGKTNPSNLNGQNSTTDPTTVNANPDLLPGGFYIVKNKENLYTISTKFGISINRLMDINNLQGFALGLNQRLKVVDDGTVPPKNRNPLIKRDETTQTTIHVVQQGQTLYGISKMYGLEIADLYRMNKHLPFDSNDIDINLQIVVGILKI